MDLGHVALRSENGVGGMDVSLLQHCTVWKAPHNPVLSVTRMTGTQMIASSKD